MPMYKNYKGSIYGNAFNEGRTKKFSDVWSSSEEFLSDYYGIGIQATIADESATTLFYLLYANYGNNRIAPNDETRFKYKLFALVFQYGPTWEKKLELQEKFRNLTDEELTAGSVQIYNSAENPSADPSVGTSEELPYIQHQNVTHNRKGKLDAYLYQWEVLKNDVTQEFLNRFRNLFIKVSEMDVDLTYTEGY